MAKAPAFQFYVKDWLADVELQAASASTRGIWINALCLMWEARRRGTLSGPRTIMSRRLNCTPEEFTLFLAENETLKFADVTLGNGVVTLSNRRMVKEEKTRNNTKLRVQRHRCNAECNADKTPPSSSSSPCTEVHPKKFPRRSDSPPADATATSGPPPAALPKLVGTLPLADGSEFEVRQNLVDELAPLYPAVEILPALRSMKSWLIGHPQKRKTQRGVMAFITGWLDRDQNNGGNAPAARASPPFGLPLTPRQQQTEMFKKMARALQQAETNHGESYDGRHIESTLPAGIALPRS